MTTHITGTCEEWLAARRKLLEAEKDPHAPQIDVYIQDVRPVDCSIDAVSDRGQCTDSAMSLSRQCPATRLTDDAG
jgi:hypothetical protein